MGGLWAWLTHLDLRRALMRARAETRNAPAEPTTARIAVGFSGELMQPSCACSGTAAVTRSTRPKSRREVFFIRFLFWEATGGGFESQRTKELTYLTLLWSHTKSLISIVRIS